MPSLVHKLQSDLISSDKSASEILRTAKLISGKLGLGPIHSWLELELCGYPDVSKLPDYRVFKRAHLQYLDERTGGWIQLQFLANHSFPIRESVPIIEELLTGPEITLPLSHEHRLAPRRPDEQQRILIPDLPFKHVLHTVKNRLIDWTIELEQRGILGENMAFQDEEKKAAKAETFHIQANIQNFSGMLAGNVSDSTVEVYNFGSVCQRLKDCGIPKPERDALEEIMDELKKSPASQKPSLLARANAWVVKHQNTLGAYTNILRKALGLDFTPAEGDSAK